MNDNVTPFPGRRRLRIHNPSQPVAQLSNAIDELVALSHRPNIDREEIRSIAERMEGVLERLMRDSHRPNGPEDSPA